jgi:hypothetical protein
MTSLIFSSWILTRLPERERLTSSGEPVAISLVFKIANSVKDILSFIQEKGVEKNGFLQLF